MITSLNLEIPACELCAKDIRVDGSRLCVSCLEAIGHLVGLTTAEAQGAVLYRRYLVAGGAR